MRYFQFIGTQRSGSNLLRVMLNQLSEVSAPHPPHILKTFFPLLARYGDLRFDKNYLLLIQDVCRWINFNPVSWLPFVAAPHHVLEAGRSRSLISIFAALSEAKARSDGSFIWCCKSMESVIYTDRIEAEGLRPIYIHLYRDGRDVALSFMNAIVGPKHIFSIARKWATEQNLALNLKNVIPQARFVSIRYEDLIRDPENTLQLFCKSVGLEFSDSMMRFFSSDESSRTSQAGDMWKNLASPLIQNNSNKFIGKLSDVQLEIFESVAGDVLTSLGYEKLTNGAVHSFSTEEEKEYDRINTDLMRESYARANPEDLRRRRPQEILLKEIVSRIPPYYEG